MKVDEHEPLFTIGIAAKLVELSQATLRLWEKEDLISPARVGKNRYYSEYDIKRLKYIKYLLQEKRLNIQGVKHLLAEKPCWEIKGCNDQERKSCPVYQRHRDEFT